MVKDKKPKTCLEDLPNELLSRIFACISLKHDLDNVQLVSRRWYAVVDETVGREIAITSLSANDEFTTCEHPCIPHAHLGCLGFHMISKMGVKTCYVDLTNSDFALSVVQKTDPPEVDGEDDSTNDQDDVSSKMSCFKFPHLLKQLYFSGAIRSDVFQSLLKDIENLVLLQINMLALSQLAPADLENIKLPQLKALGVAKCLKPTGRNFDDSLGLPNLKILLEENMFPNLRQLELRFPIQNFKDFGTIKAVLKFLSVHTVLKELYVIMEFPVQVNVTRGFQEEFDDLIYFAKKHKNRNSLRICDVQGIRLHASYPQLQIWLHFLEQQTSLTSLTLRLGYLPSTFLDQICTKNKDSLTTLFLYKLNEIMDNDPGSIVTVLDCRVFASASELQVLYAIGCDLVTNTKSLPKSVSTLFFSGVISAPDVEHILFHLPELKFVNLKNACLGRQEGFGVDLNLLQRFIDARRVKRLILNGASLSEDYPTDGLSNGDPKNPTRLMEFDNWDMEHIFLDWELNKENYYTDKCYGLSP